jgi:hypothetical protein
MRVRLDLPDGQLAAVAAVQTFGDYLNFHPRLHVLAASGLVDREGRFHVLPVEKRRGTEAFGTIERSEMDELKVRPKGKALPQSKAKPKPAGESAWWGGRINRSSPSRRRLTQSSGMTSRISDRIVGLRQTLPGKLPNSTSATDVASSSDAPDPFPEAEWPVAGVN